MVLLQVDGGALDIYNAALVLQSCTLTSNNAGNGADGGAVFLWKSIAKLSLCTLQDNLARVGPPNLAGVQTHFDWEQHAMQ